MTTGSWSRCRTGVQNRQARPPAELTADAGYWTEENAKLEDDRTELFIATKKDWKQRKALAEQGPPRGRIPNNATARDRMERKLLTRRGRAVYRQCGSTVEPVFGKMTHARAEPVSYAQSGKRGDGMVTLVYDP